MLDIASLHSDGVRKGDPGENVVGVRTTGGLEGVLISDVREFNDDVELLLDALVRPKQKSKINTSQNIDNNRFSYQS